MEGIWGEATMFEETKIEGSATGQGVGRKRKKNNKICVKEQHFTLVCPCVSFYNSPNDLAFPHTFLKPRVKLTNREYKSVAGVSLESDFLGYFLPQLYLFSYQTSRDCKSSLRNKNQQHKEQMNSWIKILGQKSLFLK